MKNKFFVLTVVLVAAVLCFCLAGGCALKETPGGEDEPGENGTSGPGEPAEGTEGPESPEEPEGPKGPGEGEAADSGAGNILNGGLVALQGGKIYYGSPADGGKLYSAAPDGSGRVKLSDDVPQYINATEHYLYYVAMGEPETIYDEVLGWEYVMIIYGPVVRINLDGSGRKVISADPAANLQLEGERLYYQLANTEAPCIYSMALDGSDKRQLTHQHSDFFTVGGDRIYYREFAELPQLCRANLDGSGRSVIYENDVYFINLLEDSLYFVGDILETEFYMGGRSLYRLGTSGGAATRMGDIEPAFLNCAGGWIYYSRVNSGEICRVKPDGSADTVLGNDYCGGIFIVGQWLYYINIDDDGCLYRMNLDGTGRLKVE